MYEVEIKREQSAYFSMDNTWWDEDELEKLTVDEAVEYFETTDLPLEVFTEVETITVYDKDGNKLYMTERALN
jgi:hypothetical protein|tara:strand:+ start:222 stop:440 length:219 start_codon:yes stop_codon:yes gene_type:complete